MNRTAPEVDGISTAMAFSQARPDDIRPVNDLGIQGNSVTA